MVNGFVYALAFHCNDMKINILNTNTKTYFFSYINYTLLLCSLVLSFISPHTITMNNLLCEYRRIFITLLVSRINFHLKKAFHNFFSIIIFTYIIMMFRMDCVNVAYVRFILATCIKVDLIEYIR